MLRPPAETTLLGLPGPLLHGLLLAAGLGLFAWILTRRLALLRRGAPDPRLDHLGTRLRRLLVVGLGQARQPRYPVAGVLHILLFAGFLLLSLRSLALLAEGFRPGLLDPGPAYLVLKDWTALVVLLACAAAALRRLLWRPARYRDRTASRHHGAEAYLVLGLIALLMLADALYEGSARAAGEAGPALPLAGAVAGLLRGTGPDTLQALHLAGFWVHNAALLLFLCFLPLGKHFHVLTALPNVLLSKLPPSGRVKPPRHDQPDLDRLERLGVGRLEDFTWKHLLDFYSCTDCGRCSDHCPAYATGTPLSPRQLSIRCRDAAYAAWPVFGRPRPAPPLMEGILEEEAIWSCTTCGACEEACPVLIEYVDKIVDLRRHLVEEGRIPRGLQKPLAALEQRGNPYGKPARQRAAWLQGGDGDAGQEAPARILGPEEETELLLFPDSAVAYDPRLQDIARATAALLARAGREVGVLGADEADSGHEARRVGEEGLFQELRERNREALAARRFQAVVTPDPHAWNALRHDYGLEAPVRHHSQILAELLAAGRLRPGALELPGPVVFHDPCFLGRHNDEYAAPRAVLQAIPGLHLVEMERCRNRSFCCGGGSLYLFHEAPGERRMGELRVEMALATGARTLVTACPFCLLNLEDAVKTQGVEERLEVVDLAVLLERATGGASPPPENAE